MNKTPSSPEPSLEVTDLTLGAQLCFPLYAVTHAIMKLYYPLLNELGLTYPQYLVMLVLWERNGLMVTEIGRTLRLDTGTLTPLLKRLEKQGFIERHHPADDKRRVIILLSKSGAALKKDAQVMHNTLAKSAGAVGCTTESIQHLKTEIYKLLEQVDTIKIPS